MITGGAASVALLVGFVVVAGGGINPATVAVATSAAASAPVAPAAVAASAPARAPAAAASAVTSPASDAASSPRDFATEALADVEFVNAAAKQLQANEYVTLEGKHPSSGVSEPPLELSVRELMGKDFDALLDNLGVASEVTRQADGSVFGSGQAPHAGGEQEAAFQITSSGRFIAVVLDTAQPKRLRIYGAASLRDLPPALSTFVSERRQ